jgi:copper(I)-binding protein
MKMRQVPGIDIKAKGEAVLKPGGLHIMMIDLKAAMKEGDVVPMTLTFDDGSIKQVDAKVVRPTAAGMAPAMEHNH